MSDKPESTAPAPRPDLEALTRGLDGVGKRIEALRIPDSSTHLQALHEGVSELGGQVKSSVDRLEIAVREAFGAGALDARDQALQASLQSAVDSLRAEVAPRLTHLGDAMDEVAARTSDQALDRKVDGAVARVPEERLRAVVAPELSSVQRKLTALEEAYEHADDVLAQLRSWIDAFEPGGAAVLSQSVEQYKRELAGTQKRLEDEQEAHRKLRTALDEKEDALRRLTLVEGRWSPEALHQREEVLAEREGDLSARRALDAEVTRLTAERDDLAEELERHKAAERSHIDQVENRAQIRRLEKEMEDQRIRADDEQRQRIRLDQRARALTQKLEQARNELQALEGDRDQREERERLVEQQRASIADLERHRTTLEKELESHRRARLEAERARDQAVDRADQELASQIAEIRQAHAQRVDNEAAKRAAEHIARAERLEQNLNTAMERQQELSKQVSHLRQASEEAGAARSRIEALEHELSRQGEVVRAALAVEHDRAMAAVKTERDQLDSLRRDAEASAASARDEEAAARRTHEQLAGQIGQAEQILADLEARIQQARGEEVPDAERLRQLTAPVFPLDDLQPVYEPQNERAWLLEIERALERAGFSFPPRLVRAFHTRLKIAEQAPLSILAGISGTGKSELPRLYASLAGIPFLSLAVQPSWDSPMDLFGFYNYTDGRLKAEPLARLLHQMGQATDPLRDGLSLVLLDEMNLARVEYYFAELLSRLESRRGLRSDASESDRRLATIDLDAGPGASAVPLFLDPRVLFVGTMNEDESTLTLSDKVLDRASVLTFPAPHDMSLKKQDRPSPRSERLSHDTWARWVQVATDNDDISKRLNEVNRIMADMGRPFGHRLFRAIHAYLTNYPGVSENEPDREDLLRDAWSDQFAMKILPRLKGLEVADGRVARGLDALTHLEHFPDDLRAAVDTSRSHEFFHWQGATGSPTESA